MTSHIKWLAIYLFLYLALFLNIERLIRLFGGTISIHPFVDFLGILIMLIVILKSRAMERVWLYQAISLLAYTAFTLGALSLQPPEKILSIANLIHYSGEAFLLIILVLISSKFSYALGEVEQAIEELSLTQLKNNTKAFTDIIEDFHTEIYRCRRHEQSLQLIIVEYITETKKHYKTERKILTEEILSYLVDRYERNKIGRLLFDITRRTDIIGEQADKKRFVILCPSRTSPIPHPDALRQRITKTVREQLNLNVVCGVAIFPDDSIIFEELIEKAELQLIALKKGAEATKKPRPEMA